MVDAPRIRARDYLGATVRTDEARLTTREQAEYGGWKKLGLSLGHFADIVERQGNAVVQIRSMREHVPLQRLATAIVLTSQGIPFLHSGQELARTKWGHHNSYDQPDALNMIRWHDKHKHAELVAYVRGLIALRRAHPMFRMARGELVRQHLRWQPAPEPCLSYCLTDPDGTDSWKKAQVLINPKRTPQTFSVAAGSQVWSESQRRLLPPAPKATTRIEVPPQRLMVLAWPKNR